MLALPFAFLADALGQLSITYNSSGTFVVPTGVTQVTVECWGGGGSGGSRSTSGVGGGGGGGAYSRSVLTVTPGNYTVTVGAGSSNTSPGGDSWFGTATTVMAKGGQSAANNSNAGATGGQASASIGNQVTRNGGNGRTSTNSDGGGGGSSAGPNNAGVTATSSTGATAPAGGGDGGNGRTNSNGSGVAGSTPGGGGGGARRSNGTQLGGNGASGQVTVSYFVEGICMNAVASNAIPDNNLTYTSIGVPVSSLPTVLGSAPGNARLESVEFIISHTTNDHLDITLTSPGGATRTLSMDRFGSGDNYGNPSSCPGSAFVMRDDGAALTNSNTNNPTGPYAPTQTLAGFTGDPNGIWSFNVRDDQSGTTGNLRYLKLNFCVVPTVPVITSNSPICAGASLSLNATSTGATNFSWAGTGTYSPNSSSAAVSVSGAVTGSYTVTASNACGSAEASVNVVVNSAPTGVTANASAASVCSNANAVDLTATGSSPDVTLLQQNFNSGAGGWTTQNNSTGGTAAARAAAAWTLRPNGYVWNGTNTVTFNSNDASQFYLTNSDATSGSVNTVTILTSPAFSTTGMTAATISFHHVFRQNASTPNDRGYVEVSTNGSSWTTLETYTTTVGTSNAFAPGSASLTAGFLNQPTVYMRFRYTAPYGWYWGIDNVIVSGTGTPAFAWTSTPSGFTSSQQNPTGVAVTQNTTYHVTATSPNGCTASASTSLVTYVPAPNAGSNNTLTICSNDAPADLGTLLGSHDAGSWSGPSTVVGDMYDPSTMSPGNYTYTVTASPCTNATATITVTENTATAWYIDADGDGFGSASDMVMACTQPMGRVANSADCDDTQLLYTDNDGDGFGAGAPVACGVSNNLDCDDTRILHADADGDGFGAAANAPCGIPDGSDCDDTQLLYADNDGDGFGAGSPVACGVANNSDCDDTMVMYADADGDGFGAGAPVACGGVANNDDDCPTAPGLVGSTCDAQPGPGFLLGQLSGSCICEATPCTENVVIELRSDANSDQIGWEILDQNTDLVLCSGGAPGEPYPYGITSPIAPNCCLPVGCYRLRVLDAGGDGFVSGGITGGYQLRESGPTGRRIIDNMGNFTSGSSSSISSAYDNGAFCVPVGDDKLIFSSCDKLDWVNNKFIVVSENPAVSAQYGVSNANSGYEFWFFDPNGGYSFRRFRSHATSDGYGTGALRANHFKVNGWVNNGATPHIPANTLLNVRVRGRVAGTNLPFGQACLFKIDAGLAACPRVKLQDNPAHGSDFSCGVYRNFGGSSNAMNRIYANPPQPVPVVASSTVRYQFRFRIPGEGICIVRPPQTSAQLVLNWTNGTPLQCTKTYTVDVRVSLDGGATWCFGPTGSSATAGCADTDDWGKVCNVTINPCAQQHGGGNSMATSADQSEHDLTLYPNPNNGDQLFLSLSHIEHGASMVNVEILDMTGKRVMARSIATADGFLKTNIDLNGDLASGLYMVNVTAGTKSHSQRLVIQR